MSDFDSLVSTYERPIYNLIFRLMGDSEEAADLTQETFVAAYRSMASFRGESSEYTWLYRIAVNKCKNRFKQRDARRSREGISLDQPDSLSAERSAAEAGTNATDPREVLERKELRARIEQAIRALPLDYRVMAVLRDLQGMSYDQIASVTGLSIDVVRTRIARARGMLRRKIEPYLAE